MRTLPLVLALSFLPLVLGDCISDVLWTDGVMGPRTIIALQRRLNREGAAYPLLPEDGSHTLETTSALQSFLNADEPSLRTHPLPVTGTLTSATVAGLQRFLNRQLGKNLWTDGVPGPNTVVALQQWLNVHRNYACSTSYSVHARERPFALISVAMLALGAVAASRYKRVWRRRLACAPAAQQPEAVAAHRRDLWLL